MAVRSISVTKAQRETLDALVAYRQSHGRSPCIEELARILGIGYWAVHMRLVRLAEHGAIRFGTGWRNLEVLDANPLTEEEIAWCLKNARVIRDLRQRLAVRQDNIGKALRRVA